jgi:tetratricopeptide (TPR) repeat protein
VLSNLGKSEESLSFFDKTPQIDPKNAETFRNKAFVLGGLEKYEESIKWLDRSIEINYSLADAWCDKTRSYTKLKDPEKAPSSLKQAIELGKQEYINKAKDERDFEELHNDGRFKKLIGS